MDIYGIIQFGPKAGLAPVHDRKREVPDNLFCIARLQPIDIAHVACNHCVKLLINVNLEKKI